MVPTLREEREERGTHFLVYVCRIKRRGMGAGKPVTKQIEEFTDVYSFLFCRRG